MANDIEYMDSFEAPDGAARYSIATFSAQSGGTGRGTGHTSGSINNGGGGAQRLGVAVAAEATKWQAVAVKANFSAGQKAGIFEFREGATIHAAIGYDTTGKLTAYRGDNGSGTVLGAEAVASQVLNGFVHVEAKVTISDTVGTVDIWVNEINVLSLTGQDTKNAGTTGLIDTLVIGGASCPSQYTFDDWITQTASATVKVGDKRVGYSAPNASGTYSAGTANTGTIVTATDESGGPTDTDYVSMDNTSLPKAISANVENAPANCSAILAVQPIATVRKDDAGSNTGRCIMISGATEVDNGADISVQSIYWTLGRKIYQTDPNTGAAWTLTAFNAIEVGWRRVS